jgi:predicted anti-sigma-YlaC factor YlaD
MMTKRPSCDDYMRMPLSEEVLEHIRSCDKCRALVNALADDLDRRAYESEHRN